MEQFGITRILGFSIADPRLAKTINDINNRCAKQCDTLETNEQKNVCGAKCKVGTQLRIISAIKQSISKAPTPQAKIKYGNDLKRAQLRLLQYQRTLTKTTVAYKKSLQASKLNVKAFP